MLAVLSLTNSSIYMRFDAVYCMILMFARKVDEIKFRLMLKKIFQLKFIVILCFVSKSIGVFLAGKERRTLYGNVVQESLRIVKTDGSL